MRILFLSSDGTTSHSTSPAKNASQVAGYVFCLLSSVLAGCGTPSSRNEAADAIQREMNQAAKDSAQPGKSSSVSDALLPPLALGMPRLDNKSLDTKFDLTVNNTPVQQVFMAIVSGTRY